MIIYLSYFDCLVIGFNMDDYHSMTLKETQWFSEGNFLLEKKDAEEREDCSKILII